MALRDELAARFRDMVRDALCKGIECDPENPDQHVFDVMGALELSDLFGRMANLADAVYGELPGIVELRASLEKYTVAPGKDIAVALSCVNTPENKAMLSLIEGTGVTLRALQMVLSEPTPATVDDNPAQMDIADALAQTNALDEPPAAMGDAGAEPPRTGVEVFTDVTYDQWAHHNCDRCALGGLTGFANACELQRTIEEADRLPSEVAGRMGYYGERDDDGLWRCGEWQAKPGADGGKGNGAKRGKKAAAGAETATDAEPAVL